MGQNWSWQPPPFIHSSIGMLTIIIPVGFTDKSERALQGALAGPRQGHRCCRGAAGEWVMQSCNLHQAGTVGVTQAWTMTKSSAWRVHPRLSPCCFVSTQAGAEQSTRIASLEQERDSLSRAAERHGEEVAALHAELQQMRDRLGREQESSKMELEMLQTQLRDKVLQGHPSISLPATLWGPAELEAAVGHGGDSQPAWAGFPVHDPPL